ncbi:MAG: LysR family transcriptional regulator [Rhodococcus sp. (in: high G+C Gram-positive bacteria)]|uniref:LysR family transcriptional regulator n=1 Tax=Rhodococcus sp. TaxID=1831 RepID=UPI003BAEE1DF
MELRQLEYFVAVAEEANFTRAAERVHISQSGISAQIRQLEHHLGATLIDRSSRMAKLTPAGEAALGHARAALASAERVRQAVDEVNQVLRGRLVVGMVTACTVTGLFDALSSFHRAHPRIDLTLIEDSSDRLVERVRSGGIDLALVGIAGAPPAELDVHPIVSEGLVAAVPPDHPLARRSRMTLAELGDHAIVCMPEGTGIRTVFDQACTAAGVTPEIALQASAPDTVADLARRGLGVAIVSESMATAYDGLTAVPLTDVHIPAVLALVWKKSSSPALRELVLHTRRAFGDPRLEQVATASGNDVRSTPT